ncbi:MAG TPA: HPr family phosphocarrier protein [Thermodesulforhabdus norvegica]|uniref:HPr family phosphocarrier protein n=1 Tax=Thermodesulforhabdus norvegica TaxID=39841 RepID=A0A7C1AWJ0_9BACT|nr:HPr family phosphocarrier protein [Deltaproteobacteria bacterium]HDL90257.1 HPr family phosphocarrier protein [Thermodesulforhabdus norvegica]
MELGRHFVVANEKGIHARVAARITEVAQRFRSEIWLEKDGNRVNGKSVLDVLSLACPRGTDVRVVAIGPDAKDALDAIADLFRKKFGET